MFYHIWQSIQGENFVVFSHLQLSSACTCVKIFLFHLHDNVDHNTSVEWRRLHLESFVIMQYVWTLCSYMQQRVAPQLSCIYIVAISLNNQVI